MIDPRKVATFGIGYGALAVATLGFLGDAAQPPQVLPDAGGRPSIRDADARKDYYFQKNLVKTKQDAIETYSTHEYDSVSAQVAPKVGASPVLHAVAPELKDVAKGIQITHQVLQGITSAAALKSRQRQDDEAAMLALFALMMDDD